MLKTPDNAYSDVLKAACAEARKYLGATSPNPAVGAAALDAQGQILAVAAHRRAGGPHAEAALLDECRAKGLIGKIDTLCLTLEPCNHHGRTPPCTEAIIAAGIKRVVVGTRDPNPDVTGGGIEKLKSAGVEVVTGVEENACRMLIHAFAYSALAKKPFITVKRALNTNGSMLPPAGQKTFTSQSSLMLAHRLRKKADAILTGSGTILADNPLFTVRHVPDHLGKKRILAILDRRRRVPKSYLTQAKQNGFEPVIYESIEQALTDLNKRSAQDVLVEAGPTLSQSILDSDLWNMHVTIRQSEPDQIETIFNPQTPIPFDTSRFDWDMFLP